MDRVGRVARRWLLGAFLLLALLALPGGDAVATPGPCDDVRATPYWTHFYGPVYIAGAPAPAGTVIQAFSPRGALVGCALTTAPGICPYLRAYGEDPSAAPPIAGMRAGEAVRFTVNNRAAETTPSPVLWHDDRGTHHVRLDVAGMDIHLPLVWR